MLTDKPLNISFKESFMLLRLVAENSMPWTIQTPCFLSCYSCLWIEKKYILDVLMSPSITTVIASFIVYKCHFQPTWCHAPFITNTSF